MAKKKTTKDRVITALNKYSNANGGIRRYADTSRDAYDRYRQELEEEASASSVYTPQIDYGALASATIKAKRYQDNMREVPQPISGPSYEDRYFKPLENGIQRTTIGVDPNAQKKGLLPDVSSQMDARSKYLAAVEENQKAIDEANRYNGKLAFSLENNLPINREMSPIEATQRLTENRNRLKAAQMEYIDNQGYQNINEKIKNGDTITPTEKVQFAQAKIDHLDKEEREIISRHRSDLESYNKKALEVYNYGDTFSDYAIPTDEWMEELKKINPVKWSDDKLDEYSKYIKTLADYNSTESFNKRFDIDENDQYKGLKVAGNTLHSLNPINMMEGGFIGLATSLDKDASPYDPAYSMQRSGEYARQQASNRITEDYGKVPGSLYDIGTSTAESAEIMGAGALLSGGNEAVGNAITLSTFGARAYNSTYNEALERGLSKEQAMTEGITSGLIEAATELIPLENLGNIFKNTKAGKSISRSIIGNWLTQAGLEGAEEFESDWANRLSDYLIAGKDGKNQISIDIQNYVDSGMSYDDAVKQVNKDFWEQSINDFGAGAVSGLILSTGAMVGGYASARNNTRRTDAISEYFQNQLDYSDQTEYGKSVREAAERYSQNPTRYIEDEIDDSTKEGKEAKETLKALADKVDAGEKLSAYDRAEIEKSIYVSEEASQKENKDARSAYEQYRKDMDQVPDEYRAPVSNMTVEDGRKAMLEAAKSGDAQRMSSVYQSMKNSTSREAQQRADGILDEFKGLAENNGVSSTDLDSLTLSSQDAYIKALNGEEAGNMSAKAQEAYNAGQQRRIEIGQTFVSDAKALKGEVQTAKGSVKLNGSFSADGKVLTNDGAISVDEISDNTFVKSAYKNASIQKTLAAKNAYIENLSDGISFSRYDYGFRQFYNAGASGISFENANTGFNKTISDVIGLDAAKGIWQAGAMDHAAGVERDAQALINTSLKIKKGSGSFQDLRKKARSEINTDAMKMMAKWMGVNVQLVDSNNTGEQASYKISTSTITVTEDHASQFFHEVAEFVEFFNPTEYAKISEAVNNVAVKIRGAENFANTVEAYNQAYEKINSDQTIYDSSRELTNDTLVAILNSKEGQKVLAETLVERYGEEEAKTTGEKIKAFFKKIIDAMKSMLDSTDLNRHQKDILNAKINEAEQIAKDFIRALDNAVSVYQSMAENDVGEELTKQSREVDSLINADLSSRPQMIQNFENRVNTVLNSKSSSRNNVLVMDHTTPILQAVGLSDEPVYITEEHVRNMNRPKVQGKIHYHGMSATQIAEGINDMYNPAMIVDAKRFPDSVLILADRFDSDNWPIVIALRPMGKARTSIQLIDSNFMKSEFGVNGFLTWFSQNIDIKNVLYANKNKVQTLFGGIGNTPSGLNNLNFDKILHHTHNIVNILNKNSRGENLDNAVLLYFRNSKVTDENRRLLPMYHGSNAAFTQFDPKKFGINSGAKLPGIWMSSDKSMAYQYGNNIIEGYVDIVNPVSMTKKEMAKEEWLAFMDLLGSEFNHDLGVKFNDSEKNIKILNRLLNNKKTDYDILNAFLKLTDSNSIEDMYQFVTDTLGYDGYIFENNKTTIAVAFSSKQVKDINNTNPTTNPDTRHSLTVDSSGEMLSQDQKEFFKDAKTVDSEGRLKRLYHGTSRADRVGNYFDPNRATSGPMAFFTDDPEIAANYSKTKADTSLSRDSEYDSYYTQFRMTVNGKDMSVSEAWNKLPTSKRTEIMRKAAHVTMDDDYENIIYDANKKNGLGNFDQYLLKEHKNNYLEALTDAWLESGDLFGEESRFLDVLKLVGLEEVEYKDPKYREEKVYEVYLNITNPLKTQELKMSFVREFEEWLKDVDQSKYESDDYASDTWDKTSMNIYTWIGTLMEDIRNNTTYSWTTIPDQVTDFLKEKGYDGIEDQGGKYSNMSHTVYIPFYSNQIKNVDNLHPTEDSDIRYSLSVDSDGFYQFENDGLNEYERTKVFFKQEASKGDPYIYIRNARYVQNDTWKALADIMYEDVNKWVYLKKEATNETSGRGYGIDQYFTSDILSYLSGGNVAKDNYVDREIHAEEAEKYFKTTSDFNKAGYLDINGKLLDFSEGQSYRVQDHREISQILDLPEDAGYSDGLIQFMSEGNIRMQSYGIDIAAAPNDAQISVLKKFFRSLNGEVTIDFSKENGDTVGSTEYRKGTDSARIISDINNYFSTGNVPEGNANSVLAFRYSLDMDSDGNKLTDGQREYFKDSKMVDEDGSLKVMYHGSQAANITIFDPKYSDDHISLFFTDRPDVAKTYGDEQYKVYLNLVNPLVLEGYNGYWNRIPYGDVRDITANKTEVDGFIFNTADEAKAFDDKYHLTEIKQVYADAMENGEAEYDGAVYNQYDAEDLYLDAFEEAESEYRKYHRANSVLKTFKEFFDNYQEYGWFDLYSLLKEYDRNAPSLSEIKEGYTYEEAVEGALQMFENDAEENEESLDSILEEEVYILPHENEKIILSDEKLTTRQIAKKALAEGYDGVIFKNISDTKVGLYAPSDVAIAFNSNQIKSVNNLNPTENNDYRYSMEVDPFIEEMSFDEDSVPVGMILDEGLTNIKNSKVDNTVVKKVASEIKSYYGSNISLDRLSELIENTFERLQSDVLSYSDALRVFKEIAQPVIDQSTSKVGGEVYSDFIRRMSGNKIRLNQEQMAEVRNAFGSYDAFKKALPQLSFNAKEGTYLDSLWGEMVEQSGYILEADESVGSQPIALYDAVQAMKPTVVNNFGGDADEVAKDCALRIIEDYLNEIGDAKSKEAVNKIKAKQTEFKDKVRANYQEKLKAAKEEMSQAIKEARYNTTWAKAENAQKIAEIKARAKNDKKEQIKRQQVIYERRQIGNVARKLMKWVTNPTDQNHVPKRLQDAVVEMFNALDFVEPEVMRDSKGGYYIINYKQYELTNGHKKYAKFIGATREDVLKAYHEANAITSNNAQTWADRMMSINDILSTANRAVNDADISQDPDLHNFLQLIDPDLAAEFDDLLRRNRGNVGINNLDVTDLKTIKNTLRGIAHWISTANKMFTSSLNVDEVVQDTIDTQSNNRLKEHTRVYNRITKNLVVDMATPETAFELQGGKVKKLFDAFNKAFETKTKDIKQASEYMSKLLEGVKDIKKWTGDKAKRIGFSLGDGDIELSIAHIMSLYELKKRPQALQHILVGGIETDAITRGLFKVEHAQNKAVHVTAEELDMIVDSLTDEQKRIADGIQKFMADECSKWGNEASMMMYNYEKFGETEYFPMQTDADTHATTNQNAFGNLLNGIEHMGFTKALTPRADNALVITDIFDVMSKHVTQMAAYHSYAPVVKDTLRWLNYKSRTDSDNGTQITTSVKKAINSNFGRIDNAGVEYFEKFLKDINESEKSEAISTAWDKFGSNYKGAAVGANLRVVIQQPTAYVRAANMINPKYLVKALPKLLVSSKEMKRITEISPTAYWKSQGYYETNMGKSLKEIITGISTPRDQVIEKSMWLAGKADDITWACLYNAIEMEQRAQYKGQGLTDEEFTEKVNERFRDVIAQTQVVDATIQKSQWMRSKDTKDKIVTAFMAEPTKSYNMAMKSILQDYRDNGSNVLKWKGTRKALLVLAVTDLLNSLAQSIIDGLRYSNDDDDYLDTVLEYFKMNLMNNLNPFERIPIVKDVFSSLYSAIKGESVYGSSSGQILDYASIEGIVDAISTDIKLIKGNYKKTGYAAYMSNAKAISYATGIPLYNLSRDFSSFWNMFSSDDNKLLKNVPKANDKYQKVYTALDKDKSDAELIEAVNKAMGKGGTVEDIKSGIGSKYKSQYMEAFAEEDTETMDDLRNIMLRGYKAAGYTESDLDTELSSWTEEKVAYSLIDNAIESGEGIPEAIKALQDADKKDDNIIEHIMNAYRHSVEYERAENIDNKIESNVNKALGILKTDYDKAKTDLAEKARLSAEKKEASAKKSQAKESTYQVIDSGVGDYKAAVDNWLNTGIEASDIKSTLTSDYVKPFVKALANGDQNAQATLVRIATIKAYLDQNSKLNIPKSYKGDYYAYEMDQIREMMEKYKKEPW